MGAHPLLLAPVPLKTLPSLAGSSSPETDSILCECLVVPAHQNPVDLRIAKSDWQSLRPDLVYTKFRLVSMSILLQAG
jgi:hypothetical protein